MLHNTTNQNKFLQYIILTTLIIISLSITSAEILVSSSIDKKFVYPDEIAFLTVKVYNDSNNLLPQVMLRIESAKNVSFIDTKEMPTFTKVIENIKPGQVSEVKVKFKVTKHDTSPTPIFVYYGEETDSSLKGLPFVSGTITQTKENNVIVTTKSEKQNSDEGEKVIITFDIKNESKEAIHAIAAEVIAPTNFIVQTDPTFLETLNDENSFSTKFEILAPIEAEGDQIITLGYGFFDSVGPHYFEKSFTQSYTKSNRTILAVIGLIVLAAAIIIYVNRTKKGNDIKGSGDKK